MGKQEFIDQLTDAIIEKLSNRGLLVSGDEWDDGDVDVDGTVHAIDIEIPSRVQHYTMEFIEDILYYKNKWRNGWKLRLHDGFYKTIEEYTDVNALSDIYDIGPLVRVGDTFFAAPTSLRLDVSQRTDVETLSWCAFHPDYPGVFVSDVACNQYTVCPDTYITVDRFSLVINFL